MDNSRLYMYVRTSGFFWYLSHVCTCVYILEYYSKNYSKFIIGSTLNHYLAKILFQKYYSKKNIPVGQMTPGIFFSATPFFMRHKAIRNVRSFLLSKRRKQRLRNLRRMWTHTSTWVCFPVSHVDSRWHRIPMRKYIMCAGSFSFIRK